MTKTRIRQESKAACEFCCERCIHREGESCPRRTVFAAMSPEELADIRKYGVEGYDVVALIDVKTLQMQMLSNVSGRIRADDVKEGKELHLQALERALKNGVYHYEWSLEQAQKRYFYQTTLIPMGGPRGKTSKVLALVRDISEWGGETSGRTLKDWSAPRTFSQILIAARESEKKEISKALHDEIGSTAVILTALLGIVKAHVKKGDQKQALADISKLDGQIKESIERVKNIVVSLRPPSLEHDGALAGSVRELLENVSEYVHIPHTFEYKPTNGESGVSDSVKIMLYRIVQEALNNIVKHACAKHIYVLLERNDSCIRLVVEDDGLGFQTRRQRSIRHVGLLAMKDSVKLVGGNISIKSAPGKGTRIEVTCPSVVYGGKE